MESDPFTSFIISPPTRERIRKISISTRIKAELTTVGVGLWTVSILETARPRALVPRRGRGRLPDAVSTLESLRPLAPVYPTSTGLHAESVPLPILPLALVNRSAEIPYISFVSGISKHPPRLTPRVNWLNGGILVAFFLVETFLWEKKVVLCWRRIEIEIGENIIESVERGWKKIYSSNLFCINLMKNNNRKLQRGILGREFGSRERRVLKRGWRTRYRDALFGFLSNIHTFRTSESSRRGGRKETDPFEAAIFLWEQILFPSLSHTCNKHRLSSFHEKK